MLQELARVFVCLGVGEVLSRVVGVPLPGSVLGLLLLLLNLAALRRVPDALGALADSVLSLLGLLFVPAGVGVIAYTDLLQTDFLPISVAVVGGTLMTFVATMTVAERLSRPGVRPVTPRQKVSHVAS